MTQRFNKAGSRNESNNHDEETVEPLKTVIVNNSIRNVEFVHFKKKFAMSPSRFNRTLQGKIEAFGTNPADLKNNQLRQKIKESMENLAKLRTGMELCDT